MQGCLTLFISPSFDVSMDVSTLQNFHFKSGGYSKVFSEWRSREAIDFPRSIATWSTRLSEDLDEICRQHSAELQRRVADLASGEGRSGNANREKQTSFPKVSYCARVCSHVYFNIFYLHMYDNMIYTYRKLKLWEDMGTGRCLANGHPKKGSWRQERAQLLCT